MTTEDLPRNIDFSRGRPYVQNGDLIAPGTRNFLRFLLYDPCARPFWAYAITFVPAFLEAILTVAIITPDDIIRERARKIAPKGRGGRTGLSKHATGTRVPGGQKNTGSFAPRALGHLLTWTQPLENIGLGILVYSAVDRSFMRWQSLIQAVAPCDSEIGSFQRSASNQSWNMLFAGGPANMPNLLQNIANWNNTAFTVGLPPGSYTAIMAAKLTPTFPASYPAGIQLIHPGLTGPRITQSGTQQLNSGEKSDFLVVVNFLVTGFSGNVVGWQTYGSTVPVGVTAVEGRIIVTRNS